MKKVGIVLLVLILLIAIALVAGYFYMKSKLDMVEYVEIPKEEIEITAEVVEDLVLMLQGEDVKPVKVMEY